jgi:hypothetical protein
MGAHHDGTRAQSAYGLKEKVSATDTRKGRPLERGSRPLGVEEAGNLMEECLLAPHCGMRHRATACEKFRDLSLQHRQSVIAEKELCASCLRHSDLDESKKRDCIRRAAPPHWVGSSVRRPGRSPSRERELPPPVEAKAGKSTYACRIGIWVKTKRDSHKEEYGASLTTLFSAPRQMSAIVQTAAVEKGVPYRTVPEVTVMLGDGRREKSTKLFFLEIKAYRSTRLAKEPEPVLVAAYGSRSCRPPPRRRRSCPSCGRGSAGAGLPLPWEVFPKKRGQWSWLLHGIIRDTGRGWSTPAASPLTSCFS